jgi:hypothetical protein
VVLNDGGRELHDALNALVPPKRSLDPQLSPGRQSHVGTRRVISCGRPLVVRPNRPVPELMDVFSALEAAVPHRSGMARRLVPVVVNLACRSGLAGLQRLAPGMEEVRHHAAELEPC